jgi:hypothetical protein
MPYKLDIAFSSIYDFKKVEINIPELQHEESRK